MQNVPTALIFIQIGVANLAKCHEYSLAKPQKNEHLAAWLNIARAQPSLVPRPVKATAVTNSAPWCHHWSRLPASICWDPQSRLVLAVVTQASKLMVSVLTW